MINIYSPKPSSSPIKKIILLIQKNKADILPSVKITKISVKPRSDNFTRNQANRIFKSTLERNKQRIHNPTTLEVEKKKKIEVRQINEAAASRASPWLTCVVSE